MDYKTINVGDKITIHCFGSSYPGTILKINQTGKTIVVGYNDFTLKGMNVGKGAMIKKLPLRNVSNKKISREEIFRWNKFRNGFRQIGYADYGPHLTEGWKEFWLDYGR